MSNTSNNNYITTPTFYLHCLRSECPRADKCLRRLAGKQVSPEIPVIHCVNPSAHPAGTDSCPYFQPIRTIRLAWGIAHIGNNLPYEQAVGIKRALHRCFSKITYHRISHHERPLTPAEQAEIENILRRNGVSQPVEYDYYTTEYDWNR